jgi:hypothetical protein
MFKMPQECGCIIHYRIENGETKNEGLCLKAQGAENKAFEDVISNGHYGRGP